MVMCVYEGQSGFSTTLNNHSVYSSFFEETPLRLSTFDHPLKPVAGGKSQVNMVGGWPAEHRWWPDSPELQLLCARWHCHDGAVDHGHAFEDTVYTMPGRLNKFRQMEVDIPVSHNSLSVLKGYGVSMAEFCKETRYHLFGSASVSFEFHRWILIWEDPHHRLLLRLGVVLVYPGFFSFFFCVPQLYLWGSPLWVRFLRMWPFFNPTIKVVTFRLHGWCMLGVFLLPAFTRLGHERQDLLSPCDEMHVSTD